jgi:hypothetical protein
MNDPVLAQALAMLDAADVAASDGAGCTDLLGAIRKVRGWVDAVEARLTSRMQELHATAGAAPAADLHTRCGGVSSAEGKRKERRSEAIEQAPSFGDALADRCEIHHIVPWELGGVTDLHDLLPVCSRHHHVLHELDWRP